MSNRRFSLLVTLLGAAAVTLVLAFVTLTQPNAPFEDYGFNAPERTVEPGPKNTAVPAAPSISFPPTDPCFQQDAECYIGRSVTGKNGQVCIIVDAVGNVRCD